LRFTTKNTKFTKKNRTAHDGRGLSGDLVFLVFLVVKYLSALTRRVQSPHVAERETRPAAKPTTKRDR